MAGSTEDEFLQIGSELQGFYQRSAELTQVSSRLVEIVSGDRIRFLTDSLRQMMADMGAYLSEARNRSNDSCSTLEQVKYQLNNLSEPLSGFQKMNKALRMLSISTKIESARLGENGIGFVNLAMDVEKLSHQVNDKSAAIFGHQQLLASLIDSDLAAVRSVEAAQDAKITCSLESTASSLQELLLLNERCTHFGAMVSSVSAEVADNISDVVASIQMHDMTRQQIEHIVEALERLMRDLADKAGASVDEEHHLALIVESGDVCELQDAQLRFASTELYTAVCTIIDSLRDVAGKQSMMASETRNVTGVTDSSGASFVDVLKRGMSAITATLCSCATADKDMSDTMKKVAQTIGEIAGFVTDIEAIGSEIDLIALNAQIKAAHTGHEGAALGVLAEAIKRLSDETVRQTDSVAATLKNIVAATGHLSLNADNEEEQLGVRISSMQDEIAGILMDLAGVNTELFAILSDLNGRVASLCFDVEQATSRIDVHERSKEMSAGALAALGQIFTQARSIMPASSEFKQNLHHMEERYTMESERHIHEALARKKSGQAAVVVRSVIKSCEAADSEFGDNIDLF